MFKEHSLSGSYKAKVTVRDALLNYADDITLVTPGPVQTHSMINQTIHDRGFPIRPAADGSWGGAQSFQVDENQILSTVRILTRKFGTPAFDFYIELREGSIDGPVHDSVIIQPNDVANLWSWMIINFNDITLQPGIDYYLVMQPAPSGVTTSFGYEWAYAFNNQYDDGSFWFTRDGGNLWRDLPSMYEFTFKIYGYD